MNRLIRYRGGRDLVSQLQDDFDRLLSAFNVRGDLVFPDMGTTQRQLSIDVDLKEEEDKYILHADVPGVKASDIEVTMESGILTIKGKRESEKKEEKDNYLRVERSSGSFSRQIPLAHSIEENDIRAKYREGVLEVILPKAKQREGRKIEVAQG